MMYTLDTELRAINPDAVLILGDTNSCVAAAYAAKRLKIPLFHMEAGNRCFDDRVPEEVNRRVVDHLSDINMPYSERARENLMRDGITTDRIIKTGSPMNEVLTDYAHDIYMSDVLARLGLEEKKYFLVSYHREENITQFGIPYCMLDAVASRYGLRILVSTHPRIAGQVHANLRDGAGVPVVSRLVEFCKPFGFFDYCKLQQNAKCVLSDSGTITEESSLLGFPALNLRETHERPEGSEEGNVIMTGMNVERVLESIPLADAPSCTPDDYAPRQVAQKVVRTILSYTDYVNRRVWYRGEK
jgi:UDP-N-acetylglucosamine 2-epimerase (non-hydrolysing)